MKPRYFRTDDSKKIEMEENVRAQLEEKKVVPDSSKEVLQKVEDKDSGRKCHQRVEDIFQI